ncbi:MAG: DUF72 domain-containing protein [Gammaproteobacteria bacterium]|nr:DUF72 domain-containing protein [Gammaproteobacteria bacterium]
MKHGIYIGTSGWSYEHWKGCFYPHTLPARDFLGYYQQLFNCVEINNTFYRLPDEHSFLHWYESVPDNFVFSVKASRFISHMKKLKDPAETVPPFMQQVKLLANKLGPILFQLPPRWRCNPQRLEAFLRSLPAADHYVFEFRDSSWFTQQTYTLLKHYNAAFCIYDLASHLSPLEVTADFVYIRLHGPGEAYCGSYTAKALRDWAKKIMDWHEKGIQVYCFFDNDQAGYAVKNALQLKMMVEV